jgi:hypothetical protein
MSCQHIPDALPLPKFPERHFDTPWAMDAASVERLAANANALPVGTDINDAVKVLGPPDSDVAMQKNAYHRFFAYYITRQRADSPIESDSVVHFAFNRQGKLEAVYSNVIAIKTRNWPR